MKIKTILAWMITMVLAWVIISWFFACSEYKGLEAQAQFLTIENGFSDEIVYAQWGNRVFYYPGGNLPPAESLTRYAEPGSNPIILYTNAGTNLIRLHTLYDINIENNIDASIVLNGSNTFAW